MLRSQTCPRKGVWLPATSCDKLVDKCYPVRVRCRVPPSLVLRAIADVDKTLVQRAHAPNPTDSVSSGQRRANAHFFTVRAQVTDALFPAATIAQLEYQAILNPGDATRFCDAPPPLPPVPPVPPPSAPPPPSPPAPPTPPALPPIDCVIQEVTDVHFWRYSSITPGEHCVRHLDEATCRGYAAADSSITRFGSITFALGCVGRRPIASAAWPGDSFSCQDGSASLPGCSVWSRFVGYSRTTTVFWNPVLAPEVPPPYQDYDLTSAPLYAALCCANVPPAPPALPPAAPAPPAPPPASCLSFSASEGEDFLISERVACRS